MNTGAALLAAAAFVPALPALAEGGPRPVEVAAFVAAARAAGCVVTEANADRVIAASGLSAEVASAVVQRLEDEGKATAQGADRLVLKPEVCQ